MGVVNEVTETSQPTARCPTWGAVSGTRAWQAVLCPAWDPALQTGGCSVLCPSQQGGHLVFQSCSPDPPPHQQQGPGRVRVSSEAP